MKSPVRIQSGLIAAGIVFLCGAALIAADVYLVGWSYATLRAVNDPAKIYFHVVLAPLVMFIFVVSYPLDRLRQVFKNKVSLQLSWCIIAMFAFVNILFSIGDGLQGFEKRIAPPQSFADAGVRSALVATDDALRQAVEHPKTLSFPGSPTLVATMPWLKGCISDQNVAWHEPNSGDDAVDQYWIFTKLLLAASANHSTKDFGDAQPKLLTSSAVGTSPSDPPAPSFIRDASCRAWISIPLTSLGVGLAMAWFWIVGFYRCGPGWSEYESKKSDGFVGAAALVLTLLAAWIVLKAYSEWYSKFYTGAWLSQGETVIVIVAIVGAMSLLWMAQTDVGLNGVTLTSVFGAITAAAAITAKIKPAIAYSVAERYRALAFHELATVHLVILFVLGVLVFAWLQDTKNNVGHSDSSQDQSDMD
jgi:hypothetical protein